VGDFFETRRIVLVSKRGAQPRSIRLVPWKEPYITVHKGLPTAISKAKNSDSPRENKRSEEAPPPRTPDDVRVVDFVMYNGETHLASYRIGYLGQKSSNVQTFVFFEMECSFTGNSKRDVGFPPALHVPEELLGRILLVTVPCVPLPVEFQNVEEDSGFITSTDNYEKYWKIFHKTMDASRLGNSLSQKQIRGFHREHALRTAKQLWLRFTKAGRFISSTHHAVLSGDVDELPWGDAVRLASKSLADHVRRNDFVLELTLRLVMYHVLCGEPGQNASWSLLKISTMRTFLRLCPNRIRSRGHLTTARMAHAGVHATNFIPPDVIKKKLESFAHTEVSGIYQSLGKAFRPPMDRAQWSRRKTAGPNSNAQRSSNELQTKILALPSEAVEKCQLVALQYGKPGFEFNEKRKYCWLLNSPPTGVEDPVNFCVLQIFFVSSLYVLSSCTNYNNSEYTYD